MHPDNVATQLVFDAEDLPLYQNIRTTTAIWIMYFYGCISSYHATVGGRFGAILAACIFLGFAVNYSITAKQPLMAEAYPTEFRNTGVSW